MDYNKLIKKTVKSFFPDAIIKTDSAVKRWHIPLKNPWHHYFIQTNGLKLASVSKVKYDFKYFTNGQIIKGKLKGSKKDIETLFR